MMVFKNLDVSFELITVIENEFRFRYVDRDRISIVLSFFVESIGVNENKKFDNSKFRHGKNQFYLVYENFG